MASRKLILAGIFLLLMLGVVVVYGEEINNTKKTEAQINSVEKNIILQNLESSNKIEKEVLDKLKTEEKVRVIVLLDNEPNDSLSLKKQSQKIKQNQNSVLNSVNKRDFSIIHQYTTLNMLALELNIKSLQALEKLNIVKEIQDDKIAYLSLSESVPLINADDVWNSLGYTGEGQTVCVIDSGVDYTHPAIGGSSCQVSITQENHGPVDSPHNYPDYYDNTWTITKTGYSQIAVHFERISLEKRYDYIEILDGSNSVVQTIRFPSTPGPSCVDKYDIWSVSVPGDTIKVRLFSDESVNCWGFKIDKVASDISWQNCGDFLGGYDYVNRDVNPMDDNGHGTHVSGIITSDDATYKGVAPDAGIIMMKTCDAGGTCYTTDTIAGIDWCISNKNAYNIKVISMSLGAGCFSSYCDTQADAIAVNRAVDNGIFVDIASGNDGCTTGVSRPACASKATSVGATWDQTTGESFNWPGICGPQSPIVDTIICFTNRGTILDLLAPGAKIYAPYLGGGFMTLFGTSMAAPHVAGLAALMLEKNPSLTPAEIETTMKDTGVLISSWKRIDAYAAVEAVSVPEVLSITVSSNNLLFGELSSETSPGSPTPNPIVITIDSSTSYQVTAKSNAATFTGPGTLNDENLEWDNNNPTSWRDYSTIEANIFSGASGTGINHNLYNQLTIPAGTTAGDYTLNLLYKVTST